MAHALADAEDSHIIAAFRAFAASDRRESKTIFMVIEKAKRERVRRVVREKVGDLAQPDTGILFALPVTFADGLYETTPLLCRFPLRGRLRSAGKEAFKKCN